MKHSQILKTAILILCTIGLLVSGYLSLSHYRVFTDITHQSFCAISNTLNCDTVSTSAWSVLLGVPLAVWGILAYGVFLWLFLLFETHADENNKPGLVLFLLAAGFCIYSLILAAISTFLIKSYCIMCMALYAVNFGLLITAYIRIRGQGFRAFIPRLKTETGIIFKHRGGIAGLGTLSAIALILIFFFPAYWNFDAAACLGPLPKGVTEDGHPYIGAKNPRLTIEEFTDYQCFQCKKMQFILRRLMAAHPDRFRIVHRHFPMDHEVNPLLKEPFHKGSGLMAMLAIYAGDKGRFWEMNDALFRLDLSKGEFKIADLLQEAGLDTTTPAAEIFTQEIWMRLREDIKTGLEHEITATPGYVIDGKSYTGQIPPEILKKTLE